ncbi:unnamed protein product [Cladocopium goreaui]|uniref:Ankyrin repeat protein L62 n=1 Tax=Cladocopium goreaui TaxID=2562237 RepID=A0A9P1G745_9DINO|nr:unnamed protein product [Cladocopium goreaui]
MNNAQQLVLLSATRDRWKPVKVMMDYGCDVSGSSGESAVLLAASRGNWNEVIRFLERGVAIDSPAAIWAFGQAAKTNRPDILEKLIQMGLSMDSWGSTKAFLDAAAGGHVDVLRSLVSHGALLTSWVAQEALLAATKKEHGEVMRYLVESRVDVTGELGDVLLETAAPGILRRNSKAARNDVYLLQILLNQGADFVWSGENALAAAGRCKSWEALHFMVLAQVTLETWAAQVAFLGALDGNHLPSLRVLENAGFNFRSERSDITIENANVTDPYVQQFLADARARRLEKNLSQVSQVLVSHAETAFAAARRGSQLVAEALRKHMELLEEQTFLVARALAEHVTDVATSGDVVASALAQHLLCPINETEQEVATALAQHMLAEGECDGVLPPGRTPSSCALAGTSWDEVAAVLVLGTSIAPEIPVRKTLATHDLPPEVADQADPRVVQRVVGTCTVRAGPVQAIARFFHAMEQRSATPSEGPQGPQPPPERPRGASGAEFLLVSRALAEHVLSHAGDGSTDAALASHVVSLYDDQMEVARVSRRMNDMWCPMGRQCGAQYIVHI